MDLHAILSTLAALFPSGAEFVHDHLAPVLAVVLLVELILDILGGYLLARRHQVFSRESALRFVETELLSLVGMSTILTFFGALQTRGVTSGALIALFMTIATPKFFVLGADVLDKYTELLSPYLGFLGYATQPPPPAAPVSHTLGTAGNPVVFTMTGTAVTPPKATPSTPPTLP